MYYINFWPNLSSCIFSFEPLIFRFEAWLLYANRPDLAGRPRRRVSNSFWLYLELSESSDYADPGKTRLKEQLSLQQTSQKEASSSSYHDVKAKRYTLLYVLVTNSCTKTRGKCSLVPSWLFFDTPTLCFHLLRTGVPWHYDQHTWSGKVLRRVKDCKRGLI